MDEPERPAHPMSPDDDLEATRTVMPTETRGAPDTAGPRLTPGQRFGHYRIERLLGCGGMGEVYEAEDLESGRRVALKILLRSLADAADRDRFLREGRLAAAVTHPHAVYVYGTEQIEDVPTIAMELASGGTLKDKVRAEGRFQPADAVNATLQVIAGLDAAARVDVLHRDIKPSNCFVGLDGTVKIDDFGLSISTLAHGETQLTLLGTVLGTPAFASPEQLRGRELDVRSDIYSVGATLYYLLTGQSPFEEPNLASLIARVVDETPTSPDVLQSGISPGLAGVVLRCLAKDPANRPASYQQLAAALEPFNSRAPLRRRRARYVRARRARHPRRASLRQPVARGCTVRRPVGGLQRRRQRRSVRPLLRPARGPVGDHARQARAQAFGRTTDDDRSNPRGAPRSVARGDR